MMSAEESVSFVIPTFREHAFGPSLDRLLEYLQAIPYRNFEIVVVDDSDAETKAKMETEIARRRSTLVARIQLHLLSGPKRGKGAAVRLGAQHSTGAVVFMIDADLPVPLRYIEHFLDTMHTTGADLVVGERPRERYANRPVRHVLSRGLWAIQAGFVFHAAIFEDTQCGFKAFRARALRDIVDRQMIERGMYDLEYLYAATLRRLRVERVAVESTTEVRPSRLNIWRCLMGDPLDIVKLKIRGARGYYQ